MSKTALVVSAKIALGLSLSMLAGCASVGEWRALRIDGSSQASFEQSVARMQQELPFTRRQLFEMALQDIWVTGAIESAAEEAGTYTSDDYVAQLDGLAYEQVIDLADQTGPSTMLRYTYRHPAPAPSVPAASEPGAQSGFTSAPRVYPAASNPWVEISPWPQNHP